MYGAIIGDLAGSIYEYEQFKKVSRVKVDKLIENDSFFSDDTVLTIAILDAILNRSNYGYYLKTYIGKYYDQIPEDREYFGNLFSPSLMRWYKSDTIGESNGNGAMMRISPIGYLYNDEQTIKTNVSLATSTSHNSKEAIEAATKIALIIYYARCGMKKEDIINKLDLDVRYKPFETFNTTCHETLNNVIHAAFINTSFESSLKEVISYGGDTDTNACITGSIAEALYGIDDYLIKEANKKIPQEFVSRLEKGYAKIKRP